MDYLHWAKVHRRVQYELTASGVPQASWADLGVDPPVELEVKGSYGDPRLIELIARRYGVPGESVVPVPGASSANFVAMAVAARHGDRVVLEHPIYQPMRRVAEFLRFDIQWLRRAPESNFAIDHDQLESHLRHGARAVVLTNLHNPSGQYIPPEEMKHVADRCARFGANLVVNEVYLDSVHLNRVAGELPTRSGACSQPTQSIHETIFLPAAKTPVLWTAARFGPHVIGLNSLTKVYGLSGLRLGWILAGCHNMALNENHAHSLSLADQQEQSRDREGAISANPQRDQNRDCKETAATNSEEPSRPRASAAHSPLAERAREIMDLLSANNAAPSMSLAIRAFERIDHFEDRFRRFHRESQPIYREWLRAQPHLHGYPNHGAIFECLRLPKGVHADALNQLLVSEYDTQIVPGSFFDLPDHIRLTPAAPAIGDLAHALRRLETSVKRLVNDCVNR